MQLTVLVTLLFGLLCQAHPLDHSNSEKLDRDYSLPDLLPLSSIPANWIASDSATLQEGRIILTPKKNSKGALWQKLPYKVRDSFTAEWTFRSINFAGKSEGGLSFWFITSPTGSGNDQKLYNGPSKFEGLQLLIDNNGPLGSTVRAQLNDGSQSLAKQNIYDHTFASCLMGYQDSSVPSMLRLTYDRSDNNLLKLQIDNKVCFQTRKVKLPSADFHLGVTADNANNDESFEILKMKMYNGVTEDSLIPNVNAMGQPKMLTKVIDQKTGTERLIEKAAFDAEQEEITNYELYKKLDRVEGKVLANDVHDLQVQVENIIAAQEETNKALKQLSTILNNKLLSAEGAGADADLDSYKDFISMNEKLEKMIQEQEKLREAAKHSTVQTGPHVDEIVRKLTIWIIPLIFIMIVMAYYTFRIRQEIVKTKLL